MLPVLQVFCTASVGITSGVADLQGKEGNCVIAALSLILNPTVASEPTAVAELLSVLRVWLRACRGERRAEPRFRRPQPFLSAEPICLFFCCGRSLRVQEPIGDSHYSDTRGSITCLHGVLYRFFPSPTAVVQPSLASSSWTTPH